MYEFSSKIKKFRILSHILREKCDFLLQFVSCKIRSMHFTCPAHFNTEYVQLPQLFKVGEVLIYPLQEEKQFGTNLELVTVQNNRTFSLIFLMPSILWKIRKFNRQRALNFALFSKHNKLFDCHLKQKAYVSLMRENHFN